MEIKNKGGRPRLPPEQKVVDLQVCGPRWVKDQLREEGYTNDKIVEILISVCLLKRPKADKP